ncbi:PTS fructose transporter subunit IIABC [[Mycoplasma] testudinis]|uniref:PTS fructose transporter subunit IIABC n=1 Tax=[Mycoplasma] testudinis TaxID=33924 RepID=UPI000697E9AE|nr:fructose-specific PTS transporter subunit EIIC [[Mycoplasma] testudinis]
MKLTDLFNKQLCFFDKEFASKEDALKFLSEQLVNNQMADNQTPVFNGLNERESQVSTGIGDGFAIPHVNSETIKHNSVSFCKVKDLNWNSLDEKPVNYIFMIALNKNNAGNDHLKLIAQLSQTMLDPDFKKSLSLVKTYEELVTVFKTIQFKNEAAENKASDLTNNSGYDFVAVTACPTGIAHTFIAAKMIENAAKELNLKVKVETQGTEGIANRISMDEINHAKGILLAIDRNIELNRFSGHQNVIETSTGSVIKDAKKQIQAVMELKGKPLGGGNAAKANFASNIDEAELSFHKFGRRLYKAILTGVSYMLPFVIFGGILIAVSFLIDINNAGSNNFGSGSSASLWFNKLGGIAFGLIVALLSAYTAFGLVGKIGILPGFICGLISNGQFLFNIDIETGAVDFTAVSTVSSGFFGAIGGGIFSAAMLIVITKYMLHWMPKSLNGIKNILIIPLFGTLLIVVIFWIINIPLIYVNYGFRRFLQIMNQPYLAPLLGLVIGVMMAVDLGGPINKAAYVFSVATLDGGQQSLAMAASMISGMVPPLGIAFSVTFFRKLWSKEERNNGFVNYVMGLSFVSEGAIPFTAANPKVMVPANIVGGAIAGVLSAGLGVTVAAPHGGIFVVALVRNNIVTDVSAANNIGIGILFMLIALIAGSIASMLMILIMTKVTNARKLKYPEKNPIEKKFVFSWIRKKQDQKPNVEVVSKRV